MGRLEQETSKSIRRNKVRMAILGSIQAAGLISLVLVVPNVASLLGRALTKNSKRSLRTSMYRLKDAGLIEFDGPHARLTTKGESFLSRNLYDMPRHRGKWDKKWRVVIFDIPEHRKGLRNKLRTTLKIIGFLKLQDSVWVFPHDCEDLIALLKADFRVGKDVLYMIVDKIENDRWIRKHFKLPADESTRTML